MVNALLPRIVKIEQMARGTGYEGNLNQSEKKSAGESSGGSLMDAHHAWR
jgi:hypothetical protein